MFVIKSNHSDFSKYNRGNIKKIMDDNGYYSPNMEMTDDEDMHSGKKLFTQKYWWQSEKVFTL